jgi:hypothetical protein
MNKLSYTLLIGVLLVTGAACEMLGLSGGGAITFTTDRSTYSPDASSATLRLHNASEEVFGYGPCFTLEREDQRAWRDAGIYGPCYKVMRYLPPDSSTTYTIRLDTTLTEGRYRVRLGRPPADDEEPTTNIFRFRSGDE